MISWLKTAKAAHFYKARGRVPVSAIYRFFKALRTQSVEPSRYLFRHAKEKFQGATWSATAFFNERRVPFLESATVLSRERICGFLLFIEYRGYVAVLRSGFDLTPDFKTKYLSRIPSPEVQAATARSDAIFEQMRLRSTAVSKHVLQRKTLEADDLQSVVGPAGANRYVPQGYRVRNQGERYSTTPSTGRIALRADRAGHEELIAWAQSVIDRLLDDRSSPAPFIRTFAQPIDLGSIPDGVQPTHFTVNVMSLLDALFDEAEPVELVRQTGTGLEPLSAADTQQTLDFLDQPYRIRKSKRGGFSILGKHNAVVGRLTLGKSRMALRTFSLPETSGLFVRRKGDADDPSGVALKRFIDQRDLFIVLFNNVSIVYLDGNLHRDDAFGDGGHRFLGFIKTDPHLANATSEKGSFALDQLAFEPNTVFRTVIDHIAAGDTTLVCDDLGDEWADFIGVNVESAPNSISFYHAKHGAPSLGASAFHDSVGQAIKNLGRMTLSSDALAVKLEKWARNYANNNVQTGISRVVRSDAPTVEERFEEAASSPDTIRRVFIVTPSLSREALANAFESIRSGNPPSAHFVQLYWLLSSYFSAALEAGVYPYVICRE
jgi:hypothetical protein